MRREEQRHVDVSVILPTYNERDNIVRLIPEIHRVLASNNIDYEIVVVDDNSPDGTAEVARQLSKQYPVTVVVRPRKLGLGLAVVDGVKVARGEIIVVMDADFQHPPDVIPRLIQKVKEGYDIAIASRYVEGGKVESWSLIRKIASKGAIMLAHAFLRETRSIKDPVSGFFAFSKRVIADVDLNPIGYKVLLEILVKGRWSRIIEVPYIFKSRASGKSKLNIREITNYLAHLTHLLAYRVRSRRSHHSLR